MKVVVTTRTRNEERNIERFMKAYGKIADEILIVDGGSTDNTVRIAESYGAMVDVSNRYIVSKPDPFDPNKTFTRNWQGKQINACISGAKSLGADWIIFDDCDCVPTVSLQHSARNILSTSPSDVVGLYRMYVYGHDKWFPDMNLAGKSLWAWKADYPIYAKEDDPWVHEMVGIPDQRLMNNLDYPNSILHYFAPSEEVIQRKINFYSSSIGEQASHPTSYGGKVEELPDWAVWK